VLAATLALAAIVVAAVTAASCGESAAPQAGVAPKGASATDAGVTNGAISYTTLNLVTMMAEQPNQVDRVNAAQRSAMRMLGEPAPPAVELDPGGTPDYFGGSPNWATSPPLRKFVDSLPGVGAAAANDLGQFIPVAVPDTVTYPGSDYYELAVREFSERLHSDLPQTRLRGYVQLNPGTGADGRNTVMPAGMHYLGPLIRARTGRAVRIKFVNQLPAGSAGKLFLPVDTTVTGAGAGPEGGDAVYPQNRASLHLQGGLTPWISGGSPYQWITPAGERSPYASGPGLVPVPDMWFDAGGRPVAEGTPGATNDPGPGATTLYFTNAQSARFLYLHDDTFGLTRLSVYAGEAAPYFVADEVEDELVAGNTAEPVSDRAIDREVQPGTLPAAELPLVIEDKTFVPSPSQLVTQDPTWDTPAWGGLGALWYPHVYMPNQNKADVQDLNAMGRWDYLPWFWKGYEGTVNGPVANPLWRLAVYEPKDNPGTPNPSAVPNAFFDTMLVNGTAYPYVKVGRQAYRLRILNGCPDRSLNLQLYYAVSDEIAETGADGRPLLQTDSGEVPMLAAVSPVGGGWPVGWPTDGRDGGVPDPGAAGPDMIQIGDDGGLLPQAVTLPTTPVSYQQQTKPAGGMGGGMGRGTAAERVTIDITSRTLWLSPGERADVVVDFSQVPAGSKLILYNDAPAPSPIFDTRLDYYTGGPDLRVIGGAAPTQPGYSPNTRTILQFQVDGPAAAPFDVARLEKALPGAYAAAQDPVLVPTAEYADVYGAAATAAPYSEETSGTLTFTPLERSYRLTLPVQGKMVSELFDPAYGRKTATLGVDAPLSAGGVRTAVPYSAIDPATEFAAVATEAAAPMLGDGTQLWRITHDGTQEHSISFSGLQVQVVARGRREGKTLPVDPRELGWKDTVRLDPLEWCLLALRPVVPELPFTLPASRRLFDVTRPEGAEGGFTELDPVTAAPAVVVNGTGDYSWEYAWTIHLPGGEESHMSRPLVLTGSPQAPDALTASASDGGVTLRWSPSIFPPAATGFAVQRAGDEEFTADVVWFTVDGAPAAGEGATAGAATFTDDSAPGGRTSFYRVRAEAPAGTSPWSAPAEVDVP
jgi:FtsP/CotA-like multicopper oxidase with cupredoxin domain